MGLLCCNPIPDKMNKYKEEKVILDRNNNLEEKELQINREENLLSKELSVQKLHKQEKTREESNLALLGGEQPNQIDFPKLKKKVRTAPPQYLTMNLRKFSLNENKFSSKDLIAVIEDQKSPITTRSATVKRMATSKFVVSPSFFRWEKMGVLRDHYEVLETIGKGKFGEVQKIRDKVTHEFRAVKIIKKNECQMAENFSEEIQILQKLDHPNVVRFYEFFQDESNYYLITEYCKGGDLYDLIKNRGKISESEVALFMKQIFTAVNYCHKQKIAHRDLKPENIVFVDETRTTLKIIDFGRSTILTPRRKLCEQAGSIYYVAPEIISGHYYNEICDVWSCGVIMYFLVTGFPPFVAESREEISDLIFIKITKGRNQDLTERIK